MSDPVRWSLPASWAGPWSSSTLSPLVECVLAPNPGPMTLDGTNTWLIGEPGSGELVLIDPGPDDARHRAAIAAAAERRQARITAILLTHAHADHSEGAVPLARDWGTGVRALDPRHCLGSEGLAEGDVIDLGCGELQVIATPGHTSDSLSLILTQGSDGVGDRLLTGDTVLGRGTAVIAHPDGELAAYLASLHRLRALVAERQVASLLPGHGPALNDPLRVIETYLSHRQERLDAVRAAVDSGARTASEVVAIVYADVDQKLWPAAEWSVQAQLRYLQAHPG